MEHQNHCFFTLPLFFSVVNFLYFLFLFVLRCATKSFHTSYWRGLQVRVKRHLLWLFFMKYMETLFGMYVFIYLIIIPICIKYSLFECNYGWSFTSISFFQFADISWLKILPYPGMSDFWHYVLVLLCPWTI